MKKMLAVARWEYVEKVKSKAFLISILIIPLIMVGLGVLPALLANRADSDTKIIGVFDQTGQLFDDLSTYLDSHYRLSNGKPNYMLVRVADSVNTLIDAKHLADALAVAGEIEGYVIIPRTIMSDTTVEYRSENVGNIRVTDRLTNAIRDLVVARKLHERGFDPVIVKQLTMPLNMRTIKLSKTGEEESGFTQLFFTAYIFMMMLLFLVMTSGQMLVRSMLEEKSNRVVEVLVSSCSATDLMGGKIIGQSGLGLTQMLIWVIIGVGISIKFGITLISLPSALLMLLYFILGYLFYAGIFVAVGAPITTEQEAQQLTSYISLTLILPIVLTVSIMQDPNSMLVKILTYVPLTTPTMMAMRIPINMPSFVEILISLVVLAGSAAGVIWAAGKIFRVTVLSYGKRPGLGELLNYLKA